MSRDIYMAKQRISFHFISWMMMNNVWYDFKRSYETVEEKKNENLNKTKTIQKFMTELTTSFFGKKIQYLRTQNSPQTSSSCTLLAKIYGEKQSSHENHHNNNKSARTIFEAFEYVTLSYKLYWFIFHLYCLFLFSPLEHNKIIYLFINQQMNEKIIINLKTKIIRCFDGYHFYYYCQIRKKFGIVFLSLLKWWWWWMMHSNDFVLLDYLMMMMIVMVVVIFTSSSSSLISLTLLG